MRVTLGIWALSFIAASSFGAESFPVANSGDHAVWGADLYTQVTHTNNINQDVNAIGANVVDAGIDGAFVKRTRTLDARANLRGAYRSYGGGAGTDVFGQGDIQVSWIPLPGELSFELLDNFGQVARDRAYGLIISNLENVNFLTVGPNYRLRLNSQDSLVFIGRFNRESYARTPLDRSSVSGETDFERGLGGGKKIGFGGSLATSTYDRSDLNSSYRVSALFGLLGLDGKRDVLQARLGIQSLSVRGETRHETYLDASLKRQLSPFQTIVIAYRQGFSDAADLFRQQQGFDANIGEAQTIQLNGDPLRNRRLGVAFERRSRRLDLRVSGEYSRERGSTQDRDTSRFQFDMRYRYSDRTSFIGAMHVSRISPVANTGDSNNTIEQIGVSFAPARSVQLSVAGEYVKSDEQVVRQVSETRVTVALNYLLGAGGMNW